jgi:hypothetical protein
VTTNVVLVGCDTSRFDHLFDPHEPWPAPALRRPVRPDLRRAANRAAVVRDVLPAPTSVAALKERAERDLGFAATRLFGDGDRVVERFAFLIGAVVSADARWPGRRAGG